MSALATDRETWLLEQAEETARAAHRGARNKHNGEDYIHHVERVVAHLRRAGADRLTLIVAWLHDVVEDTDCTLDDLRSFGFPDVTIDAVDAITHRKGETRDDYYQRVGPNRIALAVKMSDIRDNTDPERKHDLEPSTRNRLQAKYDRAIRALIPWLIHHLERVS